MPSNKELSAEANALAADLGLEITTAGLKNDELAKLASDLKAKKTDAENETQADTAPPAPPVKENAKKPAYYVAPRKALTSKKGILSGDTVDEVKAEYLAGGEDALAAFVESGHVLKG